MATAVTNRKLPQSETPDRRGGKRGESHKTVLARILEYHPVTLKKSEDDMRQWIGSRTKLVMGIGLFAMILTITMPGYPQSPAPSGKTVKIALLTSLSGPFVPWGAKVRDGMRFALKELNEKGGILKREVILVERDTKGDPAEGVSLFKGLVERERVVAVGGIISSAVGLATAKEAEVLRVPQFPVMSGSDQILEKGSRFTFRTCLAAGPMNIEAVAAFIKAKGLTRIGSLTADYTWGHSIKEAIEKLIVPLPGVTVRQEVAPVPEKDFTTYLRKLKGINPEVIIMGGHPPGAVTATKQAVELGINFFSVGTFTHPTEAWMKVLGDMALGRVIDQTSADPEHPEYRRLAEKFFDATGGLFDYNAFAGYVIVKMVADAMEKSGSDDPVVIAKTIREGRFVQPGYAYPLSYTEWGELKEFAPIIYTFKPGDPPGRILPGSGWHMEIVFRSPVVQPYVPKK